jgi:hypothetical protein
VQGIFRSSGSSFIYDHPFFFFFISPLQWNSTQALLDL